MERYHWSRNTHPSHYPIMPKNAEEKYKKAAVWFSSNKDMRLEAAMRAAAFTDKEVNDLSAHRVSVAPDGVHSGDDGASPSEPERPPVALSNHA